MADPRSNAILMPVYEQIGAQNRELFGSDEDGDAGMDLMGMLGDMPLVSVLRFQQSALIMPADEMVDGLLMQLYGNKE